MVNRPIALSQERAAHREFSSLFNMAISCFANSILHFAHCAKARMKLVPCVSDSCFILLVTERKNAILNVAILIGKPYFCIKLVIFPKIGWPEGVIRFS